VPILIRATKHVSEILRVFFFIPLNWEVRFPMFMLFNLSAMLSLRCMQIQDIAGSVQRRCAEACSSYGARYGALLHRRNVRKEGISWYLMIFHIFLVTFGDFAVLCNAGHSIPGPSLHFQRWCTVSLLDLRTHSHRSKAFVEIVTFWGVLLPSDFSRAWGI